MSNYKHLIVLSVLLCSFFFPPDLFAQDTLRHYFSLKGGMYQPTGDLEELDSGFSGEAAWGMYFRDKTIGIEVGVGHFTTDGTENGFDSKLGNWKRKVDVEVGSVCFTLKKYFPFKRGDIFIGGGLGGLWVDFEDEVHSSNLGSQKISDTDSVGEFHLTTGANYNITDRVFLGIDAKYMITGTAQTSTKEQRLWFYFWEVDLTNYEDWADLDGFTVSAVVGYRF